MSFDFCLADKVVLEITANDNQTCNSCRKRINSLFSDANRENAAWIDGVIEGVLSVGGRIVGITGVQDMMPGSKGGLIQVLLGEGQGYATLVNSVSQKEGRQR